MKRFLLLVILLSGFVSGQNILKLASYKMDNQNQNFNIFIQYDSSSQLEKVLINVDSSDEIFNEATFIFNTKRFLQFRAYLSYLMTTQLEWDIKARENNVKTFIEKIPYEETVYADNSYTGYDIKLNSYLYATYIFSGNESSVAVSSPSYPDVKSSKIFFSNNKKIEILLELLSDQRINEAIAKDSAKRKMFLNSNNY